MKYALKKQPTPYSNESFDFMNNNMTKYLEYFKDLDTIYGRNYIRLSYFSLDPKKTLKGIVDQDLTNQLFQASSYKCPFNGYLHTSIIPIAILTDNPMDYVNAHNQYSNKVPPWAEMACDPDWLKFPLMRELIGDMTTIEKTLLGSGYTDIFYPNDGSPDKSVIGIDLENGDTIVFAIMEWYNK